VNTPTSACLAQLCTIDLDTPYTGCTEAATLSGTTESTTSSECGNGNDDAGIACPPDDADGPCPAGCEAVDEGESPTETTNGAGCVNVNNVIIVYLASFSSLLGLMA
jgi:hypothetical protein